MRDLGDEYKLSFRSIDEVYSAFRQVENHVVGDRAIRLEAGGRPGRRPSRAAILNALILWLHARPVAQQRHVVAEGMERLNMILAFEGEPARAGPVEAAAGWVVEPPPRGAGGVDVDPVTGAPLTPIGEKAG